MESLRTSSHAKNGSVGASRERLIGLMHCGLQIVEAHEDPFRPKSREHLLDAWQAAFVLAAIEVAEVAAEFGMNSECLAPDALRGRKRFENRLPRGFENWHVGGVSQQQTRPSRVQLRTVVRAETCVRCIEIEVAPRGWSSENRRAVRYQVDTQSPDQRSSVLPIVRCFSIRTEVVRPHGFHRPQRGTLRDADRC